MRNVRVEKKLHFSLHHHDRKATLQITPISSTPAGTHSRPHGPRVGVGSGASEAPKGSGLPRRHSQVRYALLC